MGRPDDTCVVTGVVVRKGLVHRKMRSYIEYPKVWLTGHGHGHGHGHWALGSWFG